MLGGPGNANAAQRMEDDRDEESKKHAISKSSLSAAGSRYLPSVVISPLFRARYPFKAYKIRHVDEEAWMLHLRIVPSRTSSLSMVQS
jgi:hypothetical protein